MVWVSARVQPHSSNHSPSTLNAAISICSPPNMMTASLHQTSLANSTKSVLQSRRMVGQKQLLGFFLGFSMSTDDFIMFMEWRIIATELGCSPTSGNAVEEGNTGVQLLDFSCFSVSELVCCCVLVLFHLSDESYLYVRCFDSLMSRGLSCGSNFYVYMNHSRT